MSDQSSMPAKAEPKPPVVAGGGMAAIPGFPNHMASADGQILRMTNGKGRAAPGLVLKQRFRPNGYAVVSISGRKHFVHRLVCMAFHGLPEPSREASHEDGDQTNNSAGNLCWRTPEQNNALKRLHGTHRQGSDMPWARLSEALVIAIRSAARMRFATQTEMASMFGVSRQTIGEVINYRTWRHVE